MKSGTNSRWLPSSKLRQWMLIGVGAVFVHICLGAASLFIELSRDMEPEGFSITYVLDSSVIIPEIFVLFGFLVLAREVGSIGLWKSSIGLFGCMWLLIALAFPTGEEALHWWDIALGLAAIFGTVWLFFVVSRRPQEFLHIESQRSLSDPDRTDQVS